ncbi:MAG: carbonic anhydrase [Micavibrio sp.]|nr:MAG: carbonic anhydrase [Micavibrio sp.]
MAHKDTLIKGFDRFYEENYLESDHMPTLVESGQKPEFLIISCMDSRTAPETIFNLKPGSCFSHRPMGALVQPYDPNPASSNELAAKLAFAIQKGVSHIIIIGHTHCGAAIGLACGNDDPHIKPWLEVGQSALQRARAKTTSKDTAALARETEKQIIMTGLHNLIEYPAVQDNLGALTISGWLFDMEHGQILELDPATGAFQPLTGQEIQKAKKTGASTS